MFGFFKKRRRRKIRQGKFLPEWINVLESNLEVYGQLPDADQRELQEHILVFLTEKQFEGCGGLEMDDEIRVTIAAQACLLMLHREPAYYPSLRTILVYPSSYLAKNPYDKQDRSHRLGESWQYGPVVLAWDSSRRGAKNAFDGHNVVMHEFAHQLDQMDGAADGAPPLGQGETWAERKPKYRSWALVFSREFQRLQQRAAKGKKTVIDHYGTTNPAEFFATATEAFFEKPRQLKRRRPELYEELRSYYKQDPVAWRGSRDR
ncbi:MAG: zinc-dependent peptidase [Verrucomicrobiota bacterium]|nr:zinc-dependent peptidase [Verrucomicrobiota bacterium]